MANELKQSRGNRYPIWRRLMKIVLWAALAVVLLIYGTAVCLVTVLSPDKLTPIVNSVVNSVLEAEVSVDRVELSVKSSYPFLRLEVDSLRIVSPHITALKNDTSLHLPSYADTLLTADGFVGELNMPKLLLGKIDINDVAINAPSLNIVIVNDSVNNFDIIKADTAVDDDDEALSSIPDISLRRFSIEHADEIRFYDAPNRMSVNVGIEALLERNGDKEVYALKFSGDIAGDMFKTYNMLHVPVALNGEVNWSAREPKCVALKDFTLGVAWLEFVFDTEIDFGEELIVKSFDGHIDHVKISELLSLVPDDIARSAQLHELRTDAELALSVKLDSVFNVDRDSVPYATVKVDVPQCFLQYGNARIERLATSFAMELKGNDLNDAAVKLDFLELAGPATQLLISATANDLIDDPAFTARIDGFTNLSKLPPPLLKLVDGYVSGKVDASVSVKGRVSMFDALKFHLLNVDGDIDLKSFYWISSDTSNLAYVNNGCLKFGTKMQLGTGHDLLAVVLKTDSVNVLSGGTDVTVKDLSLGVGARNMSPGNDTTVIIPMGGGLKLSSLDVTSVSDSAGASFRDISGNVVMRRYNDMKRVPEFIFDLDIKRMAAGSRDAKMLFSGSRVHLDAHKLPVKRSRVVLRRAVDSLSRLHPGLPPDSIMAMAMAQRRVRRSSGHRVHAEMTDSSTEVIDWGTSKALNRILLEWAIRGNLSTKRAGFYTPHFPLRNRMNDFTVSFTNDTVLLHNIAYKVGRSDFIADGRITNIKRGLTSSRRISPVKIELDAASDTIDVNQIADGFFRGAVYSANGSVSAADLSVVDDEKMFDNALSEEDVNKGDTVAPILIPANIEADVKVRANNILYSDLLLHDMKGNVLVYDGALNLHQLEAASDVGSVDLSALYSAPTAEDMRFGFGLTVKRFDIARFVDLVPALDSIMPLLRDISGIVNADIAATVDITPDMDLDLPSLTAAIKLEGDSLQLLDAETFRTIAKWLMFKNKKRNIIDHMNVEMIISDNQMQLFPFIFDIDRYKIGVQGNNDLALNFNYLVSVLKSPLPFKFGITLKGNPDDYKIRLGKAKFDEKQAVERKLIVDTARINLIDQIENVFKRGVRRSKFAKLQLPKKVSTAADINLEEDPVTASDSLLFIQEGLIPAPVKEEDLQQIKN